MAQNATFQFMQTNLTCTCYSSTANAVKLFSGSTFYKVIND